jgi:hypothetical protein
MEAAGSTPERRTSSISRISSKAEPAIDNREELVRFQHPAPFCCSKGDGQRWLMHSILNRDQAGSIPASPTTLRLAKRGEADSRAELRR